MYLSFYLNLCYFNNALQKQDFNYYHQHNTNFNVYVKQRREHKIVSYVGASVSASVCRLVGDWEGGGVVYD